MNSFEQSSHSPVSRPDKIERVAPPAEAQAKDFLAKRSIGDSQTEGALQKFLNTVYEEVTVTISNRPTAGKVLNAVREKLLAAIDRNESAATPNAVYVLAKKLVKKAAEPTERPS